MLYLYLQRDKGGANRVAVSLGSYDDHELPFSFFFYHLFFFSLPSWWRCDIANWFFALMDMDGMDEEQKDGVAGVASWWDVGAAQSSVSCG